jgi:hypothetical protein
LILYINLEKLESCLNYCISSLLIYKRCMVYVICDSFGESDLESSRPDHEWIENDKKTFPL